MSAPKKTATQKTPLKKTALAKPPRPTILRGHEGEVDDVAVSPDGAIAVSVDWRETVCVWNLATGGLRRHAELLPSRITSVDFLADGRAVVAGWAAEILLFDPRDAEPERVFVPTEGRIVWQLRASPVRPRFAVATGDTRSDVVRVYEAEGSTARCVFELERAATPRFLADGTLVVVRNVATAGPEAQVNPSSIGSFRAQAHWRVEGYDADGARRWSSERVGGVLATHPSAPVLALAERDHTALRIVREPDGDGVLVSSVQRPGGLRVGLGCAACFSPDGAYLFAALHDSLLVVSTDGARRGWVERAHTKHISGLAMTPDGAKLVTSSWDKSVRVWDVPALCGLALPAPA